MSNYRVRQVLALGEIPGRQLRLLAGIATFMDDDSRSVRVGFATLITVSGNTHNTVRRARRELEDAKMLASQRGNGRGHVTLWTVLCLPEKGTNNAGTLPQAGKGTNDEPERVPISGQKGYQRQDADQRKPERGLNLRAKPSSSLSRAAQAILAAVPDATEREILEVVRKLEADPKVRYAAPFLTAAVANGDAPVLIAEARNRLDEQSALERARRNGNGQTAASTRVPPRCAMCRSGDHKHCTGCTGCECHGDGQAAP